MSYEWGCNGKGFMNELVLELGTGFGEDQKTLCTEGTARGVP